jgi:hypothetical protein
MFYAKQDSSFSALGSLASAMFVFKIIIIIIGKRLNGDVSAKFKIENHLSKID